MSAPTHYAVPFAVMWALGLLACYGIVAAVLAWLPVRDEEGEP